MKASLQEKDNVIRKLKEKISHMKERRSEADRILDFKALDFQNIELTEKVTALQEQNELFRAENEKVKHHYKELYDSIKITRAKTIEKTTSLLTENEKIKAQLKGKMQCVTMPAVKSKVLAPGINSFTEASGSKPRSNTKNNRILPAKSDNKKKCVVKYLKSVNALPLVKPVLSKVKQVWKAIGKLFANVGYQWKPTGRKFTLGEQCPLTRFTKSKVVPVKQPEHDSSRNIVITKRFSTNSQQPLTRYERKTKQEKAFSNGIPTTAKT
ncbi:hypothetical protein Tco_0387317 [Tanacetum coccineum]